MGGEERGIGNHRRNHRAADHDGHQVRVLLLRDDPVGETEERGDGPEGEPGRHHEGVVPALFALVAPVAQVEEVELAQKRQVVQQGDARYLYLNEGQAVHSVWRANSVFTGGEWDMFLTLPALIGRTPAEAVMLGNAGGTTGRAYGSLFPATRYDGVELDPAVTAVARRYFGLSDNRNLHTRRV